MKKFLLLSLGLLPVITFAGGLNGLSSNDQFAYASIFSGNFSLLLSMVIGMIATFLVFRSAQKMRGGLFGSILNYIALGMLFIVLGTIATFIDTWFSGFWFNIISTAFFALGYIFMVVGANKLLKGIMST
jgi:ABC-type spermidine/putrescine transport system permease subunit II